MDVPELLAIYDRQMRFEIEYPGMHKDILLGLIRFTRPAPGMSFISYSRPAEREIDAVIQEQVAYFTQQGLPFTWKIYEHDSPPGLEGRLLAHGFELDDAGPVFVLELGNVPQTLLKLVALDIRLISRPDQLGDVIRVEEHVWGGNFEWIRQRLGDHLRIPGYLSVYVAYQSGQPASAGWAYFYPGSQFAGLFGGSTLEEYRRRGLYTALLAVRAQEALRRGYRFLFVEPTADSQPIVEEYGFRRLTSVRQYVLAQPGILSLH
jgi:hypothetical protein